MKLRSLLLTALSLVLILSACSKNDPEGTGDDNAVPTRGSISIRVGGATTPIRSDFPGNGVTTEESDIYNYGIFIFDNKNMLEVSILEDYYEGGRGSAINQTVIEKEFTVKTGYHSIYVIMNFPTSQNDLRNLIGTNLSLEEFRTTLIDLNQMDDIIGRGNSSRGFMMTNTAGPATHNFREFDEANGGSILQNRVSVTVGRAVAKVSMAFDPIDQLGGTLSDVKYKVINNPKQIYAQPTYFGFTDILVSPHYNDATVDSNKFMLNPADGYQDASKQGAFTWTYCMENANKTPKEGNTTAVIIKGIFTPDALVEADGQTSMSATSATFWRIANLEADGSVVGYEEKYFGEEPDANIVGTNQKIVKYTDGVCYYALHLKNERDQTNSPYTVKRNSFYKVTINEVRGAGSDDEEGTIDPEEPLDAQTDGIARIVVVDWDEVDFESGI